MKQIKPLCPSHYWIPMKSVDGQVFVCQWDDCKFKFSTKDGYTPRYKELNVTHAFTQPGNTAVHHFMFIKTPTAQARSAAFLWECCDDDYQWTEPAPAALTPFENTEPVTR